MVGIHPIPVISNEELLECLCGDDVEDVCTLATVEIPEPPPVKTMSFLEYADKAAKRLTGLRFVKRRDYYYSSLHDFDQLLRRSDGYPAVDSSSQETRVFKALIKEYNQRKLPVRASYIQTEKRSVSRDTQLAIGKKVAELAKKHSHALSGSFKSEMTNEIMEMIRQEYMCKDHRINVAANQAIVEEINQRAVAFADAVLILCTSIASGACENPVKAVKELEEKQW